MKHFKQMDEKNRLDGYDEGDDFLQNDNFKFPKSFIDESSFDLSEEISASYTCNSGYSDVSLQYE